MSQRHRRDLSAADGPEYSAQSPPLPIGPAHDAHFAVTVGVNLYPGLTDLHGPRHDEAAFLDWLVSLDGGAVPLENVRQVPAPRDHDRRLAIHQARPNVADVVDALRHVNDAVGRLVTADPSAWERSRLYIYLAGHGMVPDGSDAGAMFTANASLGELGHNINVFACKYFYQRAGLFRDIVIFSDCCRTLKPGAPSFGLPFSHADSTRRVRTVLAYSTQFGASARERRTPQGMRGVFTSALVQSLRCIDSNGMRWGDLRGLVSGNMSDPELGADGQQADLSGDDDMEFGPPAGRPAKTAECYAVQVHFADPGAEPVDLLDGRLMVIGSWAARDGVWDLKLPNGLYQLVRHGADDALKDITVRGGNVVVHL
ncbi:hypothetical protein [Actinoplanes sp. NPDC051851]|uniref:hypothetical protein n=1 Tax=Actinoplanes sp. NPDC051851 TaxID=3154753 RepID=UPI0034276C4C